MPVKFGVERRARRDAIPNIPPSQNSSIRLWVHCIPATRASYSKVMCHVISKLWGRSALCRSLKSCQLELAYSLGNAPSIKGFSSQCLASYIQILMLSGEENEHPPPPPHLPSNYLPPVLPFITCILTVVPCVCIIALLIFTEGDTQCREGGLVDN
jgi:hypothetical protein